MTDTAGDVWEAKTVTDGQDFYLVHPVGNYLPKARRYMYRGTLERLVETGVWNVEES